MERSVYQFYHILPENTPLQLAELIAQHDAVRNRFDKIWADMDENERIWLGQNWSDDEIYQAKIIDGFQLESLPAVQSKLRHIVGAFRQVRTDFKVEARSDPADVLKAKITQLRLRDIAKRSNHKFTDVEVFEDALAIKFGVYKIEMRNVHGMPAIFSTPIHYRNIVWDLSSIKRNINLDAKWIAELEYKTKAELQQLFPSIPDNYFSNSPMWRPIENMEYYWRDEHGRELLTLFHHYQKVPTKVYYTIFPDPQGYYGQDIIVKKFDKKADAEELRDRLKREYDMIGFTLKPSEEPVVEEAIEHYIDYYCFTIRGIIAYGRLKVKYFPYDIFFAIKHKDKFQSFLDFLKSAQRIFDKTWAQILFALKNQIRTVYQANPLLLAESQESAVRKLQVDGGIIWTNTNVEDVVRPITKSVIDGSWGVVAQQMMNYIEDFGGGRSFFGLSQGEESGRAIYSKIAQGQLISSTFFDNFAEFKRWHGINLIEWLKYVDTYTTLIGVHGDMFTQEELEYLIDNNYLNYYADSKEGFLYVDANDPITYLADADLELQVTEEGLSESERERRWYQLVEAEKMDITGTLVSLPSWLEMKLEVMDIDPDIKRRLLDEFRQRQEMLKAQQQQMADIEKAKVLSTLQNQDVNLLMQQSNLAAQQQRQMDKERLT